MIPISAYLHAYNKKNYPPFVIRGKGWGRGEERVVGSNTKHPASIGGVWIVSGRTKFEFI